LADVLTKLVNGWPMQKLDLLLPWAWPEQSTGDKRAAWARRASSPPVAHRPCAKPSGEWHSAAIRLLRAAHTIHGGAPTL
jgi:hypothetical protein